MTHPALDDPHHGRSLSEQLGVLERALGSAEHNAHSPAAPRHRLPMSLGRPIGIRPVEFPSDASLVIGASARTLDPAIPAARRPSVRRAVTVACVSLLVLGVTAIVPPLVFRHVNPGALQPQTPLVPEVSLRTDSFAHAALPVAHPRLIHAPLASSIAPTDDAPSSVLSTSRFVPAAGEGEAMLDEGAATFLRAPVRVPPRPSPAAAQRPAGSAFGVGQ